MEATNKRAGGLLSGMPSYHVLNNQSQNSQNNDMIKLLQQEENKFWSVKPLYLFATLQMIFGVFLFSAQIAVNNGSDRCETTMKQLSSSYESTGFKGIPTYVHVYSDRRMTYGMCCGGIIFFTGLINALATKYKTSFLLVVSSFLCVVGYGVSIGCLIISACVARGTLISDDPYDVRQTATYVGMAVVSGLNFVICVLTSALFCRASCSCCQPRTPTIMYLSSVEDSTLNRQAEPILPQQTY